MSQKEKQNEVKFPKQGKMCQKGDLKQVKTTKNDPKISKQAKTTQKES